MEYHCWGETGCRVRDDNNDPSSRSKPLDQHELIMSSLYKALVNSPKLFRRSDNGPGGRDTGTEQANWSQVPSSGSLCQRYYSILNVIQMVLNYEMRTVTLQSVCHLASYSVTYDHIFIL